ncbi:MAG: S-methyl-5-thioribose-1-phosphate isomerase [Verrucomicrobiales bacterium]
MMVGGKQWRTVWMPAGERVVRVIDQRELPWRFVTEELRSVDDVVRAIRDMHVRGAGCIGATAACGMWLARETGEDLIAAAARLESARPTAVNLKWAVQRMLADAGCRATAEAIVEEDIEACRQIGEHGLELIQRMAATKKAEGAINILTHCNAGWLAFVDIGSATAPIYAAHAAGIPIHVWVDETRPRNQGSRLTAWELAQEGVPHTVIVDNAGGRLMQCGQVDFVITGADRVTRRGDVANKIGTYLKALAAHANAIPFYVALPSSTIDWSICDGLREIPIETRAADEVLWIDGPDEAGQTHRVRLAAAPTTAVNAAFDVTPAHLVTGLITERGVCAAGEAALSQLFGRRSNDGSKSSVL